MKTRDRSRALRCAIYTRVSTEQGLEQEFNSLDNQREASEAYIKSQAHEGWRLIRDRYDDGGFSGGSMDRPALQRLLDDVRARRIDVIVVYKVDRLTRSLADFAKLVELFDAHDVSFVSVTQSFNTTTSMGRLTLNVLLSFAQFEREVTGERIRDKIAASKKKGIWMGGVGPARLSGREPGAACRRGACRLRARSLSALSRGRQRGATKGRPRRGGRPVAGPNRRDGQDDGRRARSAGDISTRSCRTRSTLGRLRHKGQVHDGLHAPIVDPETWDRVQMPARGTDAEEKAVAVRMLIRFLAGKLYDDRGHRMSPSHAAKGGRRWRYYVSQALLKGRKQEAGSVTRVPAAEIEKRVMEAVAEA